MKITKRPAYFANAPKLKVFRESHAFAELCNLLRPRFKRGRHLPKTIEDFLATTAAKGLARSFNIQDRITTGDRKKLAAEIISASVRLEAALELIWSDGFEFPFQPYLDGLALDIAHEDYERWKQPDAEWEKDEETVHRCRFAIYFVLMNRMGSVFETFRTGAEQLLTLEPLVKQPHSENADRLYFLRVATRDFNKRFGSPCRGIVLTLAEQFFDCSDLDEASLSKLAPVREEPKREPIEMPEQMKVTYLEIHDRLNEMGRLDPEEVEEMREFAELIRRSMKKDSA